MGVQEPPHVEQGQGGLAHLAQVARQRRWSPPQGTATRPARPLHQGRGTGGRRGRREGCSRDVGPGQNRDGRGVMDSGGVQGVGEVAALRWGRCVGVWE